MKWPQGLRALRHRNFRWFFVGQGVSQLGTWLQMIATSWLVYHLSGSTLLLGVAAFAQQIPFLVLAPVAGVFVDRFDRRRLLVVTNSIAALQASASSRGRAPQGWYRMALAGVGRPRARAGKRIGSGSRCWVVYPAGQ